MLPLIYNTQDRLGEMEYVMNTYNTYMDQLAINLIKDCKTNATICKSKDGAHFGVCVNHTATTPSSVISKRALDSVKMALRVHGHYTKAEALEYLHVKNGDCVKVTNGDSVYTVLWIVI
jgi:hypothetical protein